MNRTKFITSILMMIIYIAPYSMEAVDFFSHINQCEEEISCCSVEIVEVEDSCCDDSGVESSDNLACESSHLSEQVHIDDCSDSIICQCCINTCMYQTLNINSHSFGVKVINSFDFKVIRNYTLDYNPFEKEKLSNIFVALSDKYDNIKYQKTQVELLSVQYFSSNLI